MWCTRGLMFYSWVIKCRAQILIIYSFTVQQNLEETYIFTRHGFRIGIVLAFVDSRTFQIGIIVQNSRYFFRVPRYFFIQVRNIIKMFCSKSYFLLSLRFYFISNGFKFRLVNPGWQNLENDLNL